MSSKTVCNSIRKHNIPKCLVHHILELERLEGVEKVLTGEFHRKGSPNEILYHIQYYNEAAHTIKITAQSKIFKQNIYLRINPLFKDSIYNYLNNNSG